MQTNVKSGRIKRIAAVNLTGMEDMLIKIVSVGGEPQANLPGATTDDVQHVLINGAPAGSYADLEPLTPDRQVRVRLEGTCEPGDDIVLSASLGKVRKIPAAPGTYRVFAKAEESGVDGQNVLLRPHFKGLVVVE